MLMMSAVSGFSFTEPIGLTKVILPFSIPIAAFSITSPLPICAIAPVSTMAFVGVAPGLGICAQAVVEAQRIKVIRRGLVIILLKKLVSGDESVKSFF